MGGHALDANTVGLWRLNTVTSAGLVGSIVDDSGNGHDLAQGATGSRTFIQGGPGGVTLRENALGAEVVDDADLCMWIPANGTTYVAQQSPGAAFLDNIRAASWTLTCRLYIESFSVGTHQLAFRFGNLTGGTGSANNELQLRIDNSTGNITLLWQHGSKVNASVTQSSGTGVAVRTWTHIAATFALSGSDWTVTLYKNGVQVGQGTDTAAGATEYDNADIVLGRNFDNSERFHGGIACIALSDVVRSPSYIAAEAEQTDSRVTADANHFALWNFQETPQAYDHGPNGLHAVSARDSTQNDTAGIAGVLGDGGFGRYHPAAASGLKIPKRQILVDTFGGASEWTLELWHRLQQGSSSANDVGLLSYGVTGEAQADNYQVSLYADRGAGTPNVPTIFWENGAGVDVAAVGATSWWASTTQDETSLKHLAVVKDSIGGGQSDVLYYRDGALVDTISALDDPDGGTGEDLVFFLLADAVAGARAHGFCDDVRLSNIARAQPEIQASYDTGADFSGPDQTVTVIGDAEFGLPLSAKQSLLESHIGPTQTAYLGLLTVMPDAAGVGGTEATGGGYARAAHSSWKSDVQATSVARRLNNGIATFPTLSANLSAVGWGLWDASSGGTLLAFGQFTDENGDPQTIEILATETPRFLDGQMVVGIR